MKFYRYIVCAFLFIGAAIAETININWLNDGETYAQTTCEIGGDVILPTTPTKRGHTFVGWQREYTRLEYIESTGTQWIDTGVKGSSGVSYEAKVSWVNLPDDRGILGARKASSDRLMLIHQYTTGHWCLSYGATNMCDLGTITKKTVYNVEAKLSNGEQYLKVDGVTLVNNSITGDVTNDFNLILFGCSKDGSPSYLSKSRVYSCKISTNDILARDFIPAKRNSDGAVGMYDTVSQTFFTNSGTGEFIAGPVADNQNFNE